MAARSRSRGIGARSRSRVLGAVVLAVATALLLTSCSSVSESEQLADDPADVTVPGPVPTAPPPESEREGVTAGANDLLDELEALREETDLCNILSGAAFQTLISEDFNTASLVSSPAGLTQVIVTVDATFEHLVDIAAPEVRPAMVTVDEVWSRLAVLNSTAPEFQSQATAILTEPQVIAANQSLGTWAALNCTAAVAPTTAAPG